MKMAGSCSIMYCFMLIINYVTVVCVTTTWADCEMYNRFGTGCNVHERVYPIYKKLERIMAKDTEALYMMKEAFFPTLAQQTWENNEVNVLQIRVCGIFNETSPPPATCKGVDNNQALRNTRCWNLRWSSSPALNVIDLGQMLAFDPMISSLMYSGFVGSPHYRTFLFAFHISFDLFPCIPSENDLTQAIVLLSSWSKAYAKAQGVPTTWSQEDQGYIARWYSYYITEGYETESIRPAIRKLLLAIFILLNLFVLHTSITVGRKMYYKFYGILKESSGQASRIYLTAGITMAAFNFLYLTATVIMYTKYDIPPIHRAKCTALSDSECSPPHTSTLYKDQVTSFIVKVVVILTAIIISLLVAIKSMWKSTLPCGKCLRIMLLWNYFVFMQIWAGLSSLPLCIFLIINPLQNLSILCAAVLLILLIAMSVLCLLQLGDVQIRMYNHKNNNKVCAHFSRCSILLPLSLTLATLYFCLSPSTSELSSFRKVIFSLVPPIVLSVFAWVVKRRFLNNNMRMEKQKKTERQLSVQSILTEEEYLPDIEQNGNLLGPNEEQRGLPTTTLQNGDISDIV